MDITKGQKNIIIVTISTIALLIVSWIFIFLPAKDTVKTLKTELLQIEGKIGGLKDIIGKDKPLSEGITILEQELENLKKRFPDSEEGTLRIISNLAHRSGLDVISFKPRKKNLLLDENKNAKEIDDCLCKKMSVSMIVRSGYLQLGSFLEALRKEVPHILTVERLNITKESGRDELKADINLTMYLLIEKNR